MNKLEFKTVFTVSDEGAITGIAWPGDGSADRYGDIITKGAFTGPTVLPMLFQHNPAQPVGVWDSTTETDAGLEVKGRLLIGEVERAREVRALVQAGAITGLSIGFSTKAATPRKGGGRVISKLELVEISLVTVPAHPGARIRNAKTAEAAIAMAEAINRAVLALRS